MESYKREYKTSICHLIDVHNQEWEEQKGIRHLIESPRQGNRQIGIIDEEGLFSRKTINSCQEVVGAGKAH